jgi:hypothetical protein
VIPLNVTGTFPVFVTVTYVDVLAAPVDVFTG